MGWFSPDIENLDDLFVHQLKDMYYAEHKIARTLPKMIEKAHSPELQRAFRAHLQETEGHIERLKQVFAQHGHDPDSVTCPAIDGIIDEAEEVQGETADSMVLDAALIASAQAVEHYEISRYGTLVAWAKRLGRPDCAELLTQNLEEEKRTDDLLTALAVQGINQAAA